MAFGGFNREGTTQPMAEINMIPLIDVMLVLLVIFIVTAPLLTHAVKIDLPKVASHPNLTQPENIQIGIRASGEIFWNGATTSQTEAAARFTENAKRDPQPEVHIRADATAPYEHVARILAAAAKAGLTRIGFVTDPREN
ncbi:MAG: biopolymer transporter ExbD [Betaproteobacteria bacterium]|nr:biopolymer transporter ExbD [Betaproteobacteria bacterium]